MNYEIDQSFGDAIAEQFGRVSDQPLTFRRHYSGRGMYGAQCFGVVVPRGAEVALGMAIGVAAIEQEEIAVLGQGNAIEVAEHMAGHAQYDNMGHDTIVYWPDVSADSWPGYDISEDD